MKRILLALFVIVTLFPLSLTGAPGLVDSLPVKLQAAIDSFYVAIDAGDADTRIGLLADDIVLMPNHWTMISGKKDVAASLRDSEGAVFKLRDREMVRAVFSGDMAYTVNSYFYTYHSEGDSPRWHKTKNVHIWQRNQQGAWKLKLDIWNSDVSIEAFKKE